MSNAIARIEAISGRISSATEGPWSAPPSHDRKFTRVLSGSGTADEVRVGKCTLPADAEFIAHAREDITFLLAALADASRLLDGYAGLIFNALSKPGLEGGLALAQKNLEPYMTPAPEKSQLVNR